MRLLVCFYFKRYIWTWNEPYHFPWLVYQLKLFHSCMVWLRFVKNCLFKSIWSQETLTVFGNLEPRCCINAPFTASNNDAGIRNTSFSLRSFFFSFLILHHSVVWFLFMKCNKRKWLFIFCSTYCFCSFNDCWTVYTVFPIHNFSTWRAKHWHSRYIYLIYLFNSL